MATTAPNAARAPAAPPETITVTVNGREITLPRTTRDWEGRAVATTMIQACEAAGVTVPHYCYHHGLPVAGNCRMCLVDYGIPALGPERQPLCNPDGSLIINKSPRPAIACATPLSPGMAIYTETPNVKAMREGVLEFLLINHPLDCPICDQGAVDLGPRIMLDDERCILCTRCIRFTRDVVKDDALGIINRGSYNTIAAYPGRQFDNNYTLNTVDICPVGALTSKDFRFKMRVWFLKETKSVCTSCAMGCNTLIGSREGVIHRLTPRDNPAVNQSWMCDFGRLNYKWIGGENRLREVSSQKAEVGGWTAALKAIANRLRAASQGSVGLIASARLANEELYLLSLLAQHLGAVTDSVPHAGDHDEFLVKADKNPNSSGARLLGLAADPLGSRLTAIADGIRAGAIQTLLVFGEDVTACGIGAELLARLETLVASDVLPSATTAAAHFVLPGCAAAEKRGSFINLNGQVQRFLKAIEPPGDARPEAEFFAELVTALTGRKLPVTMEGLFNEMAANVPAFAGLTWAELGDTGRAVPL